MQSRHSSRNSAKRAKSKSISPDVRSEKSREGSGASEGEGEAKERKKYVHHDPAIKERTPFTKNLFESESLVGSKVLELKGRERARVFGAENLEVPETMTVFKILSLMTEKQLINLND